MKQVQVLENSGAERNEELCNREIGYLGKPFQRTTLIINHPSINKNKINKK